MKEVLSLFSNLRGVEFCLWPGYNADAVPNAPEDVKVAHAEIWGAGCPQLSSVAFLDGSLVKKHYGWVPWSRWNHMKNAFDLLPQSLKLTFLSPFSDAPLIHSLFFSTPCLMLSLAKAFTRAPSNFQSQPVRWIFCQCQCSNTYFSMFSDPILFFLLS